MDPGDQKAKIPLPAQMGERGEGTSKTNWETKGNQQMCHWWPNIPSPRSWWLHHPLGRFSVLQIPDPATTSHSAILPSSRARQLLPLRTEAQLTWSIPETACGDLASLVHLRNPMTVPEIQSTSPTLHPMSETNELKEDSFFSARGTLPSSPESSPSPPPWFSPSLSISKGLSSSQIHPDFKQYGEDLSSFTGTINEDECRLTLDYGLPTININARRSKPQEFEKKADELLMNQKPCMGAKTKSALFAIFQFWPFLFNTNSRSTTSLLLVVVETCYVKTVPNGNWRKRLQSPRQIREFSTTSALLVLYMTLV